MAVAAGSPQDDGAQTYAEAIVETVREPLLVLDGGLAVVSANRAFYRHFAATLAETVGRRLYELGGGRWDIPELRRALERVLPERRSFEDVEVEREFGPLGRRAMLLNGRRLRRGSGPRAELILLAIEDVTERRRAEAELVAAKEFAEAVVDTVREPLLVLTPDLRVRSANDSFYRVFRTDPRETLGRPLYELGDGQWDIPALRRLLGDVLPDDRAFNDLVVEHDLSGLGRRSMLLNARRLDHTQLILLAIEDVTGRRRAEAAEAEWHRRFNAAVRAGGLVLYDGDRRARTIAWTGETERVLGYTPGEMGGYDWWFGRVHPDDRDRIQAAVHRALARREPFGVEYRMRCRDGRYRTVADRGELEVEAASAEVVRIVGFLQDITERRRAEEELAAAHRRTSEILESIADAFYAVDRDWRLTYVNRRTEELWGRSREELVGRRLWDIFPQVADVAATGGYRLHTEAAREGRPTHREIFSAVLGAWVAVSIYPHADGLSVYFRDITERRRAEEQGELLLAELGHRVKNLLALVQSLATQTAVRSRTVEEFGAVFEGRLLALARTHDLLFEARWRGADLRGLVSEMLEPHRLGRAEAVEVEGDPVTLPPQHGLTLSLVLHELATNAAKYGALSAAAGRVRVAWRVEDGDGGPRGVRLRWDERVGPPADTGFGTRLIERACAYELGGEARLDFDPGGLRCEIEFPL